MDDIYALRHYIVFEFYFLVTRKLRAFRAFSVHFAWEHFADTRPVCKSLLGARGHDCPSLRLRQRYGEWLTVINKPSAYEHLHRTSAL